jgi:hypothetical protein
MTARDVVSVAQAVRVLNATTHRGARDWHFDRQAQRVMPRRWDEGEYPPIFTTFECVTIARRLVEIGATGGAAVRSATTSATP